MTKQHEAEFNKCYLLRAHDLRESVPLSSPTRIGPCELIPLVRGAWKAKAHAKGRVKVNGVAITEGRLIPGDLLEIGKHRLFFWREGTEVPRAIPLGEPIPEVNLSTPATDPPAPVQNVTPTPSTNLWVIKPKTVIVSYLVMMVLAALFAALLARLIS